jgi:hypothetical protein
MTRSTVSEKASERQHDLVDDVVVDQRDGRRDALAFGHRRPLWKSYVEGHNSVHIHLLVRPGRFDGNAGYLCATFNLAFVDDDRAWSDPGRGRVGPDTKTIEDRNGGMQKAVLVDAREFMENPEAIRPEAAPSLIRLQSLDDCLRSWIDARNLTLSAAKEARAAAGVPLPVFVPEDRELRVLSDVVGQRLTAVGDGKLVGELVEPGSEIVEAVAKVEGDRVTLDGSAST